MEMHQVRYFVALCETLNFTRAAERSNVSQPSLTRAIRLLEDELGGPLFNRERNNTHLTELGRLMEPHLREVMDQARGARARARAFFELRTARLKLGLSRGVPLGHLDDALSRFAASYPDTEIQLTDDRAPALREALQRGDLELVVLPQRPHDIDELHYHPIGADHMQVLLTAGHRFAGMNGVPVRELAAEAIVCSGDCVFFEAVERTLREEGVAIRPRITVGAAEWLPSIVRHGTAVGLTSAGFGLPEGLIGRPVLDLATERDLNLATKRGRLYSPPVKAFVDIALKPRRPADRAAA